MGQKMNKENTEYLVKTYPHLYGGYGKPMSETAMCWGFDCGDGWFDIIDKLSAKLEAIGGIEASQVKEKCGSLRFYIWSGTDEAYDLIDEAEEESCRTCEECGKPGYSMGDGWIRTRCNEHHGEVE